MRDDEAGRQCVVRALAALPHDEQVQGMAWLLRAVSNPHDLLDPGVPPILQRMMASQGDVPNTKRLVAGGELTMLPIRLPNDQYVALKTWCAANHFSMATVVRGLVEKFLADQGKRSA